MADPAPDLLGLKGRRVLVTGAASGIGRATALLLARLGAHLALVDVAPLSEVEAETRHAGAKVLTKPGDLADESFLQSLLALDDVFAFANCAAVFSKDGWRSDLSAADRFDLLMRINVRAPMILGNGFVDKFGERGGGYIVLVGSAAGRNGGGIAGSTPMDYAASKGGVHTPRCRSAAWARPARSPGRSPSCARPRPPTSRARCST